MNRVTTSLLVSLITMAPATCFSQTSSIVKVPSHVWSELTQDERDRTTSRHVIDLVPSDSVGVIIDAQGVDRSDPGTTAGQQLGGAVGSAAYIDKAFRGNPDYSAKTHLGATILGMVLGGALDRPASARYQFRYTIKTLTNRIEYLDDHTTEPFRKSLGACVMIPSLSSVHQDICSETVESFKRKHNPSRGSLPSDQTSLSANISNIATGNVVTSPASISAAPAMTDNNAEIVKCKFGNNPPVAIDKGVCQSANGELLP